MVTIHRYGMIWNTRTVCAAQICAGAEICSLHSSTHGQMEGGARTIKREKTRTHTHTPNTWNRDSRIASHAIHVMIHTYQVLKIDEFLVCCAGLFDQLCIKVHVSISREREKKRETKQQPTHRRFLSIHRSRLDRIVASFLRTVCSLFLAKVMPSYCSCCCCSQDILRIASKTMHKNGTKKCSCNVERLVVVYSVHQFLHI